MIPPGSHDTHSDAAGVSRRQVLAGGAAALGALALKPVAAQNLAQPNEAPTMQKGKTSMSSKTDTVTTKDGVRIFFKDWGSGQPIVFSHGWPLSSDDWDAQMLYFANRGYRVIAHDRRGHGRSSQPDEGHDADHYADDLAALTEHLNLKNAVHVGHSTGGGEVARYIGRHGEARVAKAVLIGAVPPIMVKTPDNPGGLPKSAFDGMQAQLAANRSKFYLDLAAGPFYGFNRPGVKPDEAIIQNWWRQGMTGGAKAHYDGIVAFSQTDFTPDLKRFTVPTLVMHGDDDQIVPIADSALLSAKIVKHATLKVYKGFPHGMPTTQAETINEDILAFIRS
jgi:non-heme chloroperoxidase